MKGILWFCLILCIGFTDAGGQTLTEYVNPFIGTSNFGATNPGAVVPHGMVSVSPFNVTASPLNTYDKDTRWWSAPYAHENKFLTGFSQVNLSGVGCPELGVVLLMPTTGTVTAHPSLYGSEYSNEKASPGFYSTDLVKYGIHAEVTASRRVGVSCFVFPKGKSNILLDLGVGLTNESGAMVRIVNDHEIEGFRMTGSFCYNQGSERPVYFVAQFSIPASDFGVWKKMPVMQAESKWSASSGKFKYYDRYTEPLAGDSIGAWMHYDTKQGEPVVVKVGISYVNIENARLNLNREVPGFDFGKVRDSAVELWNKALSRIRVEGGTPDKKTIFYTALYHMLIHPNVLNDVNGEYPAMESDNILRVKGRNRYTEFSLWDTYRNLHPFLSLVFPHLEQEMVNSLVDMYKESGWLPRWELNSRETYVMEGDPAIPVIVDSYLRGIRNFDVDAAFQAMVKSATTPGKDNKIRPDIDDYLRIGYVPMREHYDQSVSHALEYYLADWNLAQFARALGKKNQYYRFLHQSHRYTSYFDPEYMMFCPRLPDGSFYPAFNPEEGRNFAPCPGFHEGTAWQYAFYVPHDIPGLVKMMGGPAMFTKKLQLVFDEGLYDATNEPDINYPYLFDFVGGQEWRTQKIVTSLIDSCYKNSPDGIPGNDDCGTLSAWLVYSMMGFYPVCPGDMRYALSVPVFDKVVIQLDPAYYPGRQILIIKHTDPGHTSGFYRVKVNGKKWPGCFISHQQLVSGVKLEFSN